MEVNEGEEMVAVLTGGSSGVKDEYAVRRFCLNFFYFK